MLKKDKNKSSSEDEGETPSPNVNGKRPTITSNTEGKKRVKTKSLYRQPTVNELNRLQETENLFNSNLFRLQVEEILSEVKVKEKTEKKFLQWFADFKNHLQAIPEDDTEYDLSEQTLSKKLKVKLPITKKLKKIKCAFKFHKFSEIEIVGSYSLGSSINSNLRIDLLVTVPADTYTKNDSINYRYHKKRAAYLAFIAAHLNSLESIENLTYTYLNGCETKPVLDIKPVGKLSNHFTVRIYLSCELEAYKLHRFSPTRNNLRESWLFSKESSDNYSETGPPTPYYNNSVLTDLILATNQEFLKETLINSENLKQAIVLLKIWLRQRKLQVSGLVISLFVAHLVQIKRINNIMSSYQIVRNVWISLKTSEWDTKGISLHKGDDSPSVTEFLQHFPVVFLDKTGYYNICWQMCKGTYYALRRESVLAVNMLDNGSINSFTPLFMVPIEPLMQFDHILRFKNLTITKESIINKSSKESRLNYGLDELALVTNSLSSLLARGLGNRADLILQMVDADFSWNVKKTPEKSRDGHEEKLSFGFILNPENALNIVEKGPSANLPEAEEFRLFWGDKSELRRFQDGSITEACVWEGDTLCERRGITGQILDYLLELKFGITGGQLSHVQGQLASLTAGGWQAAGAAAQAALDELRQDLRALTHLPLDVSAVAGTSPVFSACEPCPPVPHTPRNPRRRGAAALLKDIRKDDGSFSVPQYTPVCRAVIELGHSGKWPGDIEAFRCLKAAFNLQIAERLTQQCSLPTQAYPTHVDVLKNGLVFRLVIAHPKEITLLRREIVNGVVKYKETEESMNLYRDTVLLPRLRGALNGLQQRHPSFGPAACLVSRWLAAQLLAGEQFPAPLGELLAAAAFVRPARPEPLAAPLGPLAALARALHLLAHTDWATEMLLLDFNGDMKREDIAELERQFNARDRSQPPHMYVVTSMDGHAPSAWSVTSPSAAVLARARALAARALAHLRGLPTGGTDNALRAFVPSLEGYDVIIRIRPHMVTRAFQRVGRLPTPTPTPQVETLADDVIPVVEFDPVAKYLDELRNAYDEFALFFHDTYGGDVIGVLWKPNIHEPREFQVSTANALKRTVEGGVVTYRVDPNALVEGFMLLGRGLVEDIPGFVWPAGDDV